MGTGIRIVLLLLFSFALGKGDEANQPLNSIDGYNVTRCNSKLNQLPWKIGIVAAYLFIIINLVSQYIR